MTEFRHKNSFYLWDSGFVFLSVIYLFIYVCSVSLFPVSFQFFCDSSCQFSSPLSLFWPRPRSPVPLVSPQVFLIYAR